MLEARKVFCDEALRQKDRKHSTVFELNSYTPNLCHVVFSQIFPSLCVAFLSRAADTLRPTRSNIKILGETLKKSAFFSKIIHPLECVNYDVYYILRGCIIPYQKSYGGYNEVKKLTKAWSIIPYQKSYGGYNLKSLRLLTRNIIPYQKSYGGYNS